MVKRKSKSKREKRVTLL